ncbi:MAG: Gfo/Idh/MocA family oxidoreductase [Candidatus Bathyarchaeia archaeon]
MGERPIRVGIDGLGRSGWNIHARIFEELPGMYRVVAVCDPLEDRRMEAYARFGCRTYEDFDSLVGDDDVELIVVATPSYLHAPHTIAALESGKDAVCEKPMASNLSEADAMIDASRRAGRLLTVFHNSLFAPDYLKVMEIIQSGKLGRILMVKIYSHTFGRRWDWQTLRRFGGGELRNNGVHLIAQALQMIGDGEIELLCDLRRALTLGDAEDHVKLVLKAGGSPLVDIEVTRACAYPQHKWLVIGTQGGLIGDPAIIRCKYFDPRELPPRQVEVEPTPDRSYNREEIPWREEEHHIGEEPGSSGTAFYRKLYETIRYGAPPPVPLELARKVMWIIDRCFKLTGNLS